MVATQARVRPATADDAAAIITVHTQARTSYYRGYLPEEVIAEQNRRDPGHYADLIRSPQRTVRVAERCGQVVGFLMIGPCYYRELNPEVTSELYQFHVHPDHFRCGIGTRLHQAALEIWQTDAVAAARLWVWEFNHRARVFYSAQGWTADGAYRPDNPRIGGRGMMGYRLLIGPSAGPR